MFVVTIRPVNAALCKGVSPIPLITFTLDPRFEKRNESTTFSVAVHFVTQQIGYKKVFSIDASYFIKFI